MKPCLGEPLVERIAEQNQLPVAVARLVVVSVLEAVAEDMRGAVAAFGRDRALSVAARTMALRVEYAAGRCAVGLRWKRKLSAH